MSTTTTAAGDTTTTVSSVVCADGNHGRTVSSVAHDADDSANPFAAAERFIQHLPQAELLATAGLGHSRILKDPAVHARITTFLMRQLAP